MTSVLGLSVRHLGEIVASDLRPYAYLLFRIITISRASAEFGKVIAEFGKVAELFFRIRSAYRMIIVRVRRLMMRRLMSRRIKSTSSVASLIKRRTLTSTNRPVKRRTATLIIP